MLPTGIIPASTVGLSLPMSPFGKLVSILIVPLVPFTPASLSVAVAPVFNFANTLPAGATNCTL